MNLVRNWGFFSESSYSLLVTEYIENDSQYLLKDNIFRDWKQRFNIALAYLRNECLVSLIDCDVKSKNILLDQNLEPNMPTSDWQSFSTEEP